MHRAFGDDPFLSQGASSVTTLPKLALVGCLGGYLLASLVAGAGLLDARSSALVVSFFPSVAGLAAWLMGRLLQN